MADNDPIIIGQANTASNPGNETSLSRNEATNRTVFVARSLNAGGGIHGEASDSSTGVQGVSTSGVGVRGSSDSSFGVAGTSTSRDGVIGASIQRTGVRGSSDIGFGVSGRSPSSIGVVGGSTSGVGVVGFGDTSFGVSGTSNSGGGVVGTSVNNTGVLGSSTSSIGVIGTSSSGVGVEGSSTSSIGVRGASSSSGFALNASGVEGSSTSSIGVRGITDTGFGVSGSSSSVTGSGIGVVGNSTSGIGVFGQAPPNSARAGVFNGGINVFNGLKHFKIDHPLDPENKYLVHTSVESSEMKNVYDGVARLDEEGAAWVELPEWFEALNGDFRYQLTAVGGSAPGLHVAEEVSENRFKIAGGEEGMKVCWQLTGTRKDPWATANPFEVEQEKPEGERGRYLDPSLYDAPEEQRVMIGPPIAEAVEEEQRPPQPSGIDFARLEEEHRRQLDEWRRREEEQRREMEELRRRMEEREEEAPPEST